ncbi:MAG: tRNA threonylcarbamoyladenosine dehydratase, partial [Monoglobales bacterium]
MGTGGKMNPSMFQVADIKKTYTCPLAKVMRRELKSRGIYSLKVVFSPEQPVKSSDIIPSISFVPSSAGLLIASEVIKDLIKT